MSSANDLELFPWDVVSWSDHVMVVGLGSLQKDLVFYQIAVAFVVTFEKNRNFVC